MKRFYFLTIFLFISLHILAQIPHEINYQAVLRDSDGNTRSNEPIELEISVLQGNTSGTEVCYETFDVTTNSFGLINIQIGSVNTTAFSSIDWANGPYYIKISVDGTEFGTSQLLSVPYALHAKTAESLTESITESDPVFLNWNKSTGISITESQISDLQTYLTSELDPAFSSWDKSTGISITESQISDLQSYLLSETDPSFSAWNKSYLDLINIPDIIDSISTVLDTTSLFIRTEIDGDISNEIQNLSQVLSEDNDAGAVQIKNVADPTDDQDAVTKAYVDELEQKIKYLEGFIDINSPVVGDYYGGGVVFYIFQSGDAGYVEGETHGLICAISDQATAVEWGCYGSVISGADGTAIGTGAQNTIDLEAGCSESGTAPDICANLDLNGYTDWFLPSKNEALKMYENRSIINTTAAENGGGSLGTNPYWTSTEDNQYRAFHQRFSDGQSDFIGRYYELHVRAIREF